MEMPGPIEAKIRNTRRYADLLEVLARHGFASMLAETGLDRLIERGREMLGGVSVGETVHLPMPVRLRLVLEELGPTYIKLGQILSTRPDLIPPEIAEEFGRLQSDCPKEDFADIRARLDKEYLGRVDTHFRSIDPDPIGAGSIAQSHRAVLADGTPVILKVLRPGIHELVEADLEVLGAVARFAEKHFHALSIEPTAVLREFARHILRELDLQNEARSIRRLTTLFLDTPKVQFPRLHPDLCTANVIAMEEVKGILLSRLEDGQLTPEERVALVEAGTTAVFRMCLEFGFFHADPHPGNIFALPDGVVCFIDLGMTGHIDEKTQGELAGLVAAVVEGNLDRVVRLVLSLVEGEPSYEFDRTFRSEVWEIVTRFQSATMEQLDIANMLQSIFALLRVHHIRCPGDLVFLIKALITIQGVGEKLAPDFDLVGHVQPLVKRVVMRQHGPAALRERFMQSMWSYLELVEGLPRELRTVGAELRRRNFSLRMQHEGIEELETSIEHAARSIAIAVILAAIIIGASILSSGSAGTSTGVLFPIIGFGAIIAAGVYAFSLWRGK